MFEVNDLFVETVVRERERQVARMSREAALLRDSRPPRAHGLRERLGLGLIQAGRALLRREPEYAASRHRVA